MVHKVIAILANLPVECDRVYGGVDSATIALLEGLRSYQDQFDFHVISIPAGLAQDQHEMRDGFIFHFVSLPKTVAWVRPRMPARIYRVRQVIKEIAPDLIHCQDNMALALGAIWSGHKRLFTIHGVKRHEARLRVAWERWSATADALIEPFVYHNFVNFICISNYAQSIVDRQKLTFAVPNAVRSAFFDTPRNPSTGHPLLLFVGLLSPLKRPEDLLQAHLRLRKCYPGLKTVFCGEAESQSYGETVRRMEGEGIVFAGMANQESLKRWLGQAAVLDVDQLVLCLEKLLRSSSLADEFGKRGKVLALYKYHPDQVARQTVEIYRKLLANSE
jgi:glycosyltransferase involved in cell wall biosynthesis